MSRPGKGFRQTGRLIGKQIRVASEARGFTEAKLLTYWAEIAGQDIAQKCNPIEVKYKRGDFGATLVVLTTGSYAPVLKMEEPKLRDRINACYGYNAIAHIRVIQTAPTGFAEGQAMFLTRQAPQKLVPSPEAKKAAAAHTAQIQHEGLRAALERLGTNIISKNR